jgi:hypothetical protein
MKCADGHRFESWFQSGESFERLRKTGHLSCAVCGRPEVEKAIMAPAVSTKGAPIVTPAAPPPDSVRDVQLTAPSSPVESALRELRARVEANAENVGRGFADEARAIHLGEANERAIYGQATGEEARALIDDGVDIAALPWIARRDS